MTKALNSVYVSTGTYICRATIDQLNKTNSHHGMAFDKTRPFRVRTRTEFI